MSKSILTVVSVNAQFVAREELLNMIEDGQVIGVIFERLRDLHYVLLASLVGYVY